MLQDNAACAGLKKTKQNTELKNKLQWAETWKIHMHTLSGVDGTYVRIFRETVEEQAFSEVEAAVETSTVKKRETLSSPVLSVF